MPRDELITTAVLELAAAFGLRANTRAAAQQGMPRAASLSELSSAISCFPTQIVKTICSMTLQVKAMIAFRSFEVRRCLKRRAPKPEGQMQK
jgi:hypothetical protein